MKNKKRTQSRILSVMLALVMAVSLSCSVFSVDTYAASSKSQVNTAVNKLMKGIKQCNEKNVNACMPKNMQAGYTDLKATTPGLYSYIKKANNKMSYKITKTTVKKNRATVKVKVKYADGAPFCENFLRVVARGMMDGSVDPNAMSISGDMSDAELFKLIQAYDNLFAKAANLTSVSKMRTQTITLKLVKSGKSWRLSAVSDDLNNVMTADVSRAMQALAADQDAMMQIIMSEMYGL